MDDLMQWKCVLDRLLPSERARMMIALPDVRPLQATVYRDLTTEIAFIREGLNDWINYDRSEAVMFAAALRNYRAVRSYAQQAAGSPSKLEEMMDELVRYGDARSLEILAEEAPDTHTYSKSVFQYLDRYNMSEVLGETKLRVLSELFGYTLSSYRVANDIRLSPVSFRGLNRDSLSQLVAKTISDNHRVTPWARYEYVRKALLLSDGELPEAMAQRAQHDEEFRALIETAQMALAKGH